MCVMFVQGLVGVVCGLVFVCIMVGVCTVCWGKERRWRQSVLIDMFVVGDISRLEIVLLPRAHGW